MHRIVVLGAGTGGTLAANRLRRAYSGSEAQITVVDQDDRHVYQPGLLFVPFGLVHPEDVVRPRSRQLRKGIEFLVQEIDRVDLTERRVQLMDGRQLSYDVLVIATGAVLAPEETEGLIGQAWGQNVFTFYDLESSQLLADRLRGFDEGRLVVNVVEMPIKCPVAPLEFCFLADWFFHQHKVRNRIDITFVTPLDGAFTTPVASRRLGGMLDERGISLISEFNTAEVDATNRKFIAYDGREVSYDLAVVIPIHNGAAYVMRSPGLGDAVGFVQADEHTLQAKGSPNVFVIGDAAAIPTSKAGSVTHFEGEVIVENVQRFLAGQPLDGSYDGHANCFIETGFSKAMLVDFNYDTEPLPGHFPNSFGLPLMKESRLNHLGKLAFQWLYWHCLLPGWDIPGLHSAMPTQGKDWRASQGTGTGRKAI